MSLLPEADCVQKLVEADTAGGIGARSLFDRLKASPASAIETANTSVLERESGSLPRCVALTSQPLIADYATRTQLG